MDLNEIIRTTPTPLQVICKSYQSDVGSESSKTKSLFTSVWKDCMSKSDKVEYWRLFTNIQNIKTIFKLILHKLQTYTNTFTNTKVIKEAKHIMA
jgi:hypothetical protein